MGNAPNVKHEKARYTVAYSYSKLVSILWKEKNIFM